VRMLDKGSGWVRFVQFLPDGKRVALAREKYEKDTHRYEGEAKVCRVSDGTAIHTFHLLDRAMCGALSPDGARLAVGVGDGEGDGPFPEKEARSARSVFGRRILAIHSRTFSLIASKFKIWSSIRAAPSFGRLVRIKFRGIGALTTARKLNRIKFVQRKTSERFLGQ
jgi:hypothetical protein